MRTAKNSNQLEWFEINSFHKSHKSCYCFDFITKGVIEIYDTQGGSLNRLIMADNNINMLENNDTYIHGSKIPKNAFRNDEIWLYYPQGTPYWGFEITVKERSDPAVDFLVRETWK